MSEALARLAALVRRETGNDLPEGRLGFLAEAAERRARAAGCADLAAYVGALEEGALRGEWDVLASLLTIKESAFFRVPQQWEQLRARLLPELVRRRADVRRLRAWSAACAAGEEPGTLALVLAEMPVLAGWDWSILATDLDAEALAHAERGLYGDRSVAAVPPQLRATRFLRRGALWELEPGLRERIFYRRLNLAQPLWRLTEERYDLVFLRNVLIYFRPELQRQVVAEVARRLAPDGWLFLGGSETLWRVQEGLEAVDLGDCFAYRLAGAERPVQRPAARAAARAAAWPAAAPPAPARRAARPASAVPSAPTPAERILAAVAHLEAERVDEASRDVEAALADDPADPAAHTLAGLIADVAGRTESAAAAFRAALYLEPNLVQVRLLLAGCLRRMGEAELAGRQYREIVTTLERGAARRLPALDGRLLPDPQETLRRARQSLAAPRGQ